jgi:two-component system, sensor histidine kinase FlrB
VKDVLPFAPDRQLALASFDVLGLLRVACAEVTPGPAERGIDIRLDVPPSLSFRGDAGLLEQAVRHLVLNAMEAMPHGGELVITAVRTRRGLELEVADSGPGVAVEQRHRIFQPFYTTKPAGQGLGLALVRQIVELHAGEVDVMNCPEGGAAFTICLPNRAMEAAA